MNVSLSGSEIILGNINISPFSSLSFLDKKIDWPGEYHIQKTSFFVLEQKESLAFFITTEGVHFFSPAKIPISSENDLNIDVVFILAESSEFTISQWKVFLEDADPRMILFCENGEKTTAFKKEMGIANTEEKKEISISSKTLPADKTRYFQF